MINRARLSTFFAIICLLVSATSWTAEPAANLLETPVAAENLDAGALAQWVDGAERPIRPKDERDKKGSPAWVVATVKGNIGHSGLLFGQSKTPGGP